MAGMAEVGRLFNDNRLIVAEVLQSAEVMKAAVSHLERYMERKSSGGRGKVILATVKGDVHDIGKNLVEIVLANNGFEVVNLGIKVPSEQLIQAVREHRPDVIGLSGLLVKSAQQMVLTAGDFAAVGIDVPLVVGGAALTRRFTHRKIAPAYASLCTYAKDAMHGLSLVERLTDPAKRPELEREIGALVANDNADAEPVRADDAFDRGPRRSTVRRDLPALPPPDLDRHVAELDLDAVWAELNPQMVYGKHLGLKGVVRRLAAEGDEKYRKLEAVIEELKALGRAGAIHARAVWRFFPAQVEGERLTLRDPDRGGVAAEWTFPRQSGPEGLCLADYVSDSPGGITWRSSSPRRGKGCASGSRPGSAMASTSRATLLPRWRSRRRRRRPNGCTRSSAPTGASPIRRSWRPRTASPPVIAANATVSAIRPARIWAASGRSSRRSVPRRSASS